MTVVLPSLTVVVPTLDEELAIGSCLDAIGRPPETALVVTDGGSTDGTLAVVARQRPDAIVVRDAPGRGGQLRRGVEAAPADGYVFVHADCRLPAGWYDAVREALADPAVALGCFRLHTEPPPDGRRDPLTRAWWRLLDLRSRGLGLPYGDQAQFCRRDVLEAVGGFPAIPLMEDLELARRCLRIGRLARIPLEVRTTARRFSRLPIRARACVVTFPTLYRLGVSPERLARWYGAVR
ncbi:MAG TPA: glycosyltransferase [Methylomirabilota bacterium]|nr:glycosyltransferase [Methylomirabilota bacterium]